MVLLPVLRSRWFFLSPGALVGWFFLFDFILGSVWQNWKLRRGTLLAGAALLFLLRPRTDSHVFSLLLDKVKFFFQKPADPGLLSPETRIMWVEDFFSPRVDQLIYLVGPLLVLALPMGWRCFSALLSCCFSACMCSSSRSFACSLAAGFFCSLRAVGGSSW
jgi:hypothetical protein